MPNSARTLADHATRITAEAAPGAFSVFEEYLDDCRTLPPSEWLTGILLPLQPR